MLRLDPFGRDRRGAVGRRPNSRRLAHPDPDRQRAFRTERRLNPAGSYSEIATLGPDVTSQADTTVAAGQVTARVRAYNAAGNSGYSNKAGGTAATLPSVVVTVVKVGTGTVTLVS